MRKKILYSITLLIALFGLTSCDYLNERLAAIEDARNPKKPEHSLTTKVNNEYAGSITHNVEVDEDNMFKDRVNVEVEKSVTLTANTNEGFVFDGWFNGDELLTDKETYTFNMPYENVSYIAKWTPKQYKITIYDNFGMFDNITISGVESGKKYDCGSEIVLEAEGASFGTAVKWTRSDNVVSAGNKYIFRVPANDITISASTTTIPYELFETKKLTFGTYPQTEVAATTHNGLSSITFDEATWIEYKNYDKKETSDEVFYKDVDVNGDGTLDYRGVYIIYHGQSYTGDKLDRHCQIDNGYTSDTIYWFRYDPIVWDILKEENGKALIIADLILDYKEFYPSFSKDKIEHIDGGKGYANNYELSTIRKWLNDTFYETAFNDIEKTFIDVTMVDNTYNHGIYKNKYDSNNTLDKLFLLSYDEAYNTSGKARGATNYAKCLGLRVVNDTSSWWLRTYSTEKANYARYVNEDGKLQYIQNTVPYDYCYPVNDKNGVRPVCWIYYY